MARNESKPQSGGIETIRRRSEGVATCGLLLICVALAAPFVASGDLALLEIFKWVYSAGALVYVCARVAGARDNGESVRLRRLRRMEFWGGMCFVAGAAFWFYSERHLGPYAGMLAVLRQTILFTLAGAVIQVISSWLIVSQTGKENSARKGNGR